MRLALIAGAAAFGLFVGPRAMAQQVPAASTGAVSGTVAASDPAGSQAVEEVVVTAQKRSENVQQVPIAETVVSAAELSRRGTQTVQDLSQASGSLEFTATSAEAGGGAFVRGIGTETLSSATAQSSVSVVLDGVVLGDANINDIFDLDRVEVLKGPQGTLFGSSVSAGVISLTTKAPVIGQLSGYIDSEFADTAFDSGYDRGVVRTAVNVPINSTSALRVSGYVFDNWNLEHDTYSGANSDETDYGFRVRYLNHLTDDLTLNFIADYSKSWDNNDSPFVYAYAPPDSPLLKALKDCGVTPSSGNVDNCDGFPEQAVSTIAGVSAQFDYDFGGMTGTSITSYRQADMTEAEDIIDIAPSVAQSVLGSECHFTNCNPVVSLRSGTKGVPETINRGLFTQEVRLASASNHHLEWVLGAYYENTSYKSLEPTTLTVNIAGGAPFGNAVLSRTNLLSDASTADYAAFGNATYYLTPATRLIAGLRYTYSVVREGVTYKTLGALDPTTLGSIYGFANADAEALTFRAGVQHDFSPDTMLYATISSGYKAPQINDSITTGPVRAIKAERPINYELGVKQSLFGRRLSVDGNLFYEQVDNFQTESCVPSATLGIACANVNVPQVVTKGAEIEIFGRPFRGNTTDVSAAYIDATYPDNFRGADGSLLAGHQLNYAPKFKVTVSSEQDFPVSDRYTVAVGGDLTYRSSESLYLSALPQFVLPDTLIGNLRLGVRGSGWSAFIFSRNVGDYVFPAQFYPTAAFAPGGLWHILSPNSRRVVGLQLKASF